MDFPAEAPDKLSSNTVRAFIHGTFLATCDKGGLTKQGTSVKNELRIIYSGHGNACNSSYSELRQKV